MDDYLSKPLEMPKLKATLRKWMPPPIAAPARAAVGPRDSAEVGAGEAIARAVEVSQDTGADGGGPIDPSALKEMFGDDPETFRQILQEFVDPARANIKEIDNAVAERSAAGVGRGAHKLKSSARAVGAHELADLCVSLEAAGQAGDWGTIEADAPQLSRIMSSVEGYVGRL